MSPRDPQNEGSIQHNQCTFYRYFHISNLLTSLIKLEFKKNEIMFRFIYVEVSPFLAGLELWFYQFSMLISIMLSAHAILYSLWIAMLFWENGWLVPLLLLPLFWINRFPSVRLVAYQGNSSQSTLLFNMHLEMEEVVMTFLRAWVWKWMQFHFICWYTLHYLYIRYMQIYGMYR